MSMDSRISIEEYALKLAETAALRSEDPYQKVGAVALDHHNRVVACAYNGLLPKFDLGMIASFDRNQRLKYMVHAEQNLCSLFKRGEVKLVATTLMPCASCLLLLAAHGVEEIIYRDVYLRDQESTEVVAELYRINLRAAK